MPVEMMRAAEPRDLPAIEAVVRAAYTVYLPRMTQPPGPMRADYAALVREGTVTVVEREGAVVGLVVLIEGEDHLLLDNVAVAPEWQGRGLGRRLIAYAEREALRRGFRELRLYTHVSMTENVVLYTRLGFEETHRGKQAGFQRVFMRKRLDQGHAAGAEATS